MSQEDKELRLRIPDHVPSIEAAEMLNLSNARVLQLIRQKRLPATKVTGRYMIPKKAVEDFKRNPPGRSRQAGEAWYSYSSRVRVLNMQITVRVQSGKQGQFVELLEQLYGKQQHTFKGTMIRVIWQSEEQPQQVTILLVWKNNEMPDEETRQQELAAFQHDFADVLDWETAHIEHGSVLLSTQTG